MSSYNVVDAPLQRGQLLLEASAGTGKTRAIIGLVMRFLLSGSVESLSQILVVTFTNAATAELKTRLRKALRATLLVCKGGTSDDELATALAGNAGANAVPILTAALAAADEMAVYTIHSFCRRVLEDAAFETGAPFALEFVVQDIDLRLQAAQDAVRTIVQTRDSLTASVAIQQKLLPENLLQDYADWQRHPNTYLSPTAPPLDEALISLRNKIAPLRLAASRGLPIFLNALPFPKTNDLAMLGDQLPDAIRRRLLDESIFPLELLIQLSQTNLKKPGKGLKNLGKLALQNIFSDPFIKLCTELENAANIAGRSLRVALLDAMHARLSKAKSTAAILSLQDLLTDVNRALTDPQKKAEVLAAVRSRYHVAMIDEFQDTDPQQYRIFRACFEGLPLMLVGDPKQSIYAFRGADLSSYMAASKKTHEHGSLGKNFRSHPDLVKAVAQIFAGPMAFAHDQITMKEVLPALSHEERELAGDPGRAMQIRHIGPRRKSSLGPGKAVNWIKEKLELCIATDVARECARLLRVRPTIAVNKKPPRPLCASDIAILVRTNDQASLIQAALRKVSIVSALTSAGDLFATNELRDVRHLIAGLLRGAKIEAQRAAWTTSIWGILPATLKSKSEDAAWQSQQMQLVDDLQKEWYRNGFASMFAHLSNQTGARSRFLLRADGERILTNYLQVIDLLTHATTAQRLTPEAQHRWLERQCANPAEVEPEQKELRLESDFEAVQVMTMHGSKGLQFEIVFVPFLGIKTGPQNQPIFLKSPLHLQLAGSGTELVRYKDATAEQKNAAAHANIAENVRLAYVALTRAKRRCYVHWGSALGSDKTCLAWLLHGPGSKGKQTAPITDEWHKQVIEKSGWAKELQAIANASDGAISYALVETEAPAEDTMQSVPRSLAKPRPMPTAILDRLTVASFTSLTRNSHVEYEPDHDQGTEPFLPPAEEPLSSIHAFARGAKAGTCLHAIFEHMDFADTKSPTFQQLVETTLRDHDLLEGGAHKNGMTPIPGVIKTLQTICNAKLPKFGFSLSELSKTAQHKEWRFLLPAKNLNIQSIADAFHANGKEDYAQSLRRLHTTHISAFLTGSIDLICCHENRYYVFDWKSNFLGNNDACYTTEAMQEGLDSSHYTLQYHIYLLALHRLLKTRLKNYRYEKHVGGACYVYLRGAQSATHGFIVDVPPLRLIEALESLLGGPA